MTPDRFKRIKAVLQRRQPDLTVVMENVHKPHNLAAIVRTCDAVGIQEIHAVAKRQDIALKQKSASGANKWVSYQTHPTIGQAYAHLHSNGFSIIAARSGSKAVDFRNIDYTVPSALVVGAELDGISAEAADLADHVVDIPMLGMVDSLNVSVATALILFEASRQRTLAGMYQSTKLDPMNHEDLLFEWAQPQVARFCRQKKLPYPKLGEDGEIIGPFPHRCDDSDT